ncbi:MAG: hypothetical protein QM611_04480 [Microbacterium sp.]|uniref:hypothetical protein n=1 Tax=Microbacterium sp. TaxID=51671 RepID=UPI0039E5E91B
MTDALLRDLVDAARSAPSAHNTQPWAPRIVDGAIELGVAAGRTLPIGDPTGRDTLVGLGAWTEAAAIAAAHAGRRLEVEALPAMRDPEAVVLARRADPVARLTLGDEADDDELWSALGARLTYRGPVQRVPGFLSAVAATVPDGMRLVPIAARDLTRFATLGFADILARRGVAEELAAWLRLSPRHPRYELDGLSDRVLLLPRAAAAAGAPFTRRRRLRDAAAFLARHGGDLVRRTLLEVPVEAAGDAADADHFALVVDSNELSLGSGAELTRVLNSPLGLPAETVFDAGRALMRVWLQAAQQGIAFAPHSEVLDSALAQGELEYRLGLGRRAVPLFVASVGRPVEQSPPRSPRLPG